MLVHKEVVTLSAWQRTLKSVYRCDVGIQVKASVYTRSD